MIATACTPILVNDFETKSFVDLIIRFDRLLSTKTDIAFYFWPG